MPMPICAKNTRVQNAIMPVQFMKPVKLLILIQVGIRSMDVIEKTVMDEEKVYFAHEMAVDDCLDG